MRDKTKYIAYINSFEWQEKRKEVFKAKGYKCEACGISESLQVHHGTYRRLYRENIKDLFVLCGYCHITLHEKYGTRDLLRATKAFIQGQELIPRKKSSKARGKSKKIRQLTSILVYGKFRLQRCITHTRVEMIISTRYNEKKYKRFMEKWRKPKANVTVTINSCILYK